MIIDNQLRFVFVLTPNDELFSYTITCYLVFSGRRRPSAGTALPDKVEVALRSSSLPAAMRCAWMARTVKFLHVCNYNEPQIQLNLYLTSLAQGLFYFNLSPGKLANSLGIYQEIGNDVGCRGSRGLWVALVAGIWFVFQWFSA